MAEEGKQEAGRLMKLAVGTAYLAFGICYLACLGGCGFPDLPPEPALNLPPTAFIEIGGRGVVARGAVVTLDGVKSADPDGDRLTYHWEQVSGEAIELTDPAAAKTSFTAPKVGGVLVVSLTVSDGIEQSAQALVEISVTPNGVPVAIAGVAGPATVGGGAQVVLDGEASEDPDGDPLTYEWEQIAGAAVTFDDPSAARPSFTAPLQAGTLTFGLRVSDGTVTSERALVQVSVEFNARPVAQPGPPVETPNLNSITLLGGGTDADGDVIAAYAWTVDAYPNGTTYQISGANTQYPSFTPLGKGTYTLDLKVYDGKAWSLPTALLVKSTNNPPSVVMGYALVETTNTYPAVLTAAAVDVDGDPVTGFEWTVDSQPAGSSFNLLEFNDVASFRPFGKGTYKVRFRASDGTWSDYGQTLVVALNAKPVAGAAAVDAIPNQATAYLSGSGTDLDGDSLVYAWSVVSKPVNSSVIMQTSGPSPSFVPNGKGVYVVQLSVGDGSVWSDPVTTGIRALNRAPVAHAGGPYTGLTAEQTFGASGINSYDLDGDPLTYSWRVLPDTATYAGQTPVLPVPAQKGSKTLELTVSDGTATHTATAAIDVDNLAPLAAPTGPTAIPAQSLGRLFSNQSSDPDGPAPNVFRWTQIEGPAVTLSSATAASPSFTAPDDPQDVVFELEVSDGQAWSEPAQLRISTSPVDSLSVFVSGNDGNDANPGTQAGPKKTIMSAIAAADAANPKKSVVVAAAVSGYTEAVVMRKDVHLYGGFSTANAWARNADVYETKIFPTEATNFTVLIPNSIELDPVILEGFTIQGPAGSVAMSTTFGVKIVGAAATVRNNQLIGGGEAATTTTGTYSAAVRVENTTYPVLLEDNYIENGYHPVLAAGVHLDGVGMSYTTTIRRNRIETKYRLSGAGMKIVAGVALPVWHESAPLIESNRFLIYGSAPMTLCAGFFSDEGSGTRGAIRIQNNFAQVASSCLNGANNFIHTAGGYQMAGAAAVYAWNNTMVGTTAWNGTARSSTGIFTAYFGQVFNNYFQDFEWGMSGSPGFGFPYSNNLYVNAMRAFEGYYGTTLESPGSKVSSADACTFANIADPSSADYYRLTGGTYCIDQGKDLGLATDAFGNARPYDVPGANGPSNSDGSDIGWSEYRPE